MKPLGASIWWWPTLVSVGQQPVARQTLSGVRETIETNFLGAVATLLPVVPSMIARGSVHLVVVTS